jgi:hypothetical protein
MQFKVCGIDMKWLRRFLGMRGSFSWACRQMLHGRIVRPASASCTVKYRFNNEVHRRLQCSFERADNPVKWDSAFFFYSDMLATDWVVVSPQVE